MRGLRESLLALMVSLTAAPVCAQTAPVVTRAMLTPRYLKSGGGTRFRVACSNA